MISLRSSDRSDDREELVMARIACLLTITTVIRLAASESYAIDPDASRIAFTGHSTLHDFSGTAKVKQGQLTIDGDRLSGFVTVDARTMNTRDAHRDKDMHADMAVDRYPEISFTVTEITGIGDHLTAHGTWSMHGVDRPLAIPVTRINGEAPRLVSAFQLNFNDFGIEVPPKLGMKVRPQIDITVNLLFRDQTDRSAASS
jgi:polyisoprenoid-binding protein YceI